MHQDLHGKQQNSGQTLIVIREIGVRFEGRDLLATNGPHEVPGWFAYELIASGRAREAQRPAPVEKPEPPKDVVHNDPVVTNSDPVVTNTDPKPRGRGPRR